MIRKILFALISILGLLFIGSLIFAVFQPRPHSFHYSLNMLSKQPYGCSIIKSELPSFYPNKNVRALGSLDLKPYYDYVTNYDDYGYFSSDDFDSSLVFRPLNNIGAENFNFIALSGELQMSQVDINSLLSHCYQGNAALLLADDLNDELGQTLGIKASISSSDDAKILEKAFSLRYRNRNYLTHKSYSQYSFIEAFPPDAEIICTNKLGKVIGIRLNIGTGSLVYFSMPILFSNLHLLKDRREIVESLLLELPNRNTYYAQYTGGRTDNYTKQPNIMSFIHSQESLTWAFYTLLFSVLIFMAFRIRRSQRIIPIVKPPENTSLKYIETLSNLYLLHNNHKETSRKKMNYFLNRIRLEYHLDSQNINEEFYLKLSQKSGVDRTIIKQLFIKYHYINARQEVTSEDFQALCELLQHFKN
tara:strand:+ start:73810 stop:75063 length:1254 start_codon:yes stop_codon:yes gene_type:complete